MSRACSSEFSIAGTLNLSCGTKLLSFKYSFMLFSIFYTIFVSFDASYRILQYTIQVAQCRIMSWHLCYPMQPHNWQTFSIQLHSRHRPQLSLKISICKYWCSWNLMLRADTLVVPSEEPCLGHRRQHIHFGVSFPHRHRNWRRRFGCWSPRDGQGRGSRGGGGGHNGWGLKHLAEVLKRHWCISLQSCWILCERAEMPRPRT